MLVRLVGKKSNRDGIGARLRVTAGGKTQVREVKAGSSYLSQNDLRAHVACGAETIDRSPRDPLARGRNRGIARKSAGQ